jgi:Flp pilus assembly protein TadD
MIEQCPAASVIESGLGLSLAMEGNYEAAKAELHKAIEIDPHDLTALYNLGGLAIRPYRHIHFAAGLFAVAVEVWLAGMS